eukprot:TRINITY_DN6042_c0_g1_i1.p1 TRINITY_DN6042_c0_g1~~TRINITY_DN6042_c0_g1_i1.p1  ORF type:complete len:383 (-),score=129.53 TRINITY_DN6042_c0_g1_i1:88-1080(-)
MFAKEKDKKESTLKAFQTYYEQIYTPERWSKLYEAMLQPTRYCCLVNRFCEKEVVEVALSALPDLKRLDFISIPAFTSSVDRFPHPEKDSKGIYNYYPLDAASLLAVEALDVQANHSVLDICAAPGGKSLAILQYLTSISSNITCNEIAPDRKRRLKQVIHDYIPKSDRDRVIITGRDATRWEEEDRYDRVLVDAPCSSERHLLKEPLEFEKWTTKKTVNAAKDQFSILRGAVRAVKEGGILVYGTCSISTQENDSVVEKALKKCKVNLQVMRREWPIGEKTKYGWIVLPDDQQKWGPLYFTILKRLSDDGNEGSDDSEDFSDSDDDESS